jgi:peptide/nickel transport system permease protein
MKMAVYVIRRAALVVPVIVGVMTITFALITGLGPEQQILAQHGIANHVSKCPITSAYCKCTAIGLNQSGSCKNPAYWRVYDKLRLNEPLPVQWAYYMYRSFSFQWGNVSNSSNLVNTAGGYTQFEGIPVTTFLGDLLPYTIELAILSLMIILAVSIPLGNLSAVNRNRPIDQASRVMSFSGYAVPSFLLGGLLLMGSVLMILSFSHGVQKFATPWCPSASEPLFNELYGSWPQQGCYTGVVTLSTQYPTWLTNGLVSHPTGFPTVDAILHGQNWLSVDTLIRMILPAVVIAYGAIAGLLRFVRNSMLEVMNLDYVRTARAKGVPEKTVISKHAGRNSMNVTITVLGLTFAFFIGGFPVVETVFNLNGIGRALALAVQTNNGPIDVGVVFGSTILFTYLVVAANIIVDVLYAYLDPRVRLG